MRILPDIHVSFKYLKYTDGNNCLELDLERGDKDAIIYIPNEAEWEANYIWTKGRRKYIIDYILNYINQLHPDYIYRVKEF